MRYHLFLIASDFLATNYACATLLRGASVITLPQSKSSQPILSKQLYHNVNDNKKYNDDHAATALEDITACPDSKNAVDLMLDDSDAIGNVWITNSYHHSRAENASRRVPKEKTCVNMSIDQKRIASKLEAVYIYYKCTPPPQERNRQEAIYFNHHFDLHDYSSLTSTWCLETLECDHNDDFFGAKSNGYIAFHAQFDSNDQNQKESKTLMNTENKFSLDLKRDMLRHRRGQVVDASLDTTFIPSVDEEYQGVQIVRDKPTFDVYSPGSTGPGESTTVTVQKPPPLRKDPLEDTPIALEVSDGPIVENVVNNVAVDGDTPVFDADSEGGQISPDSSSPEVVLTVVEPTTDGEGSPVSESIATVVDENLRITDPGPDSVILDTYPNGISNTGGGDTTEDEAPIASVSEGNLGLVNVRDDLTFDVYTPGSTGPGESTTVTVQKPPSLVVDPPDDTPIALEVSDGPIVENVVNNEAADGDTPVFDADSEGGQISPDSSSPEVVLTVVEPTTDGEGSPVSESIATVVDENLRITDPGPDSVILDTYPNGISNTGGGDTTEDKTPIASVSEGNLGLVNVRDDLTFDVYTPGSTGPGESTTVTVQKPPSLVVDPPDDTPIALEVSDGPIVENVVNNEAADGDTPVFDADSEGGQISPDSSSPEVVLTVVEPTTDGEGSPVSESIATVVDENLRITDPGPDSVILDTYPNGISNTGGGDTTEDKTPIASVSEGNLGLVNVRDDLTFDVYTPGSTGPGESTTVTVQKPPSLVVDPPDDTPIALEVSDGPIVENVVNNEAADGDTPVFDADSEGGQISPDSSSPEVVLTVVEPTTEGEVAPEIVTQTDVLNLNVPVEIETPDVADPELTIVGDGENEALPVILDVFPPENVVVDDEPAEDPPEYRPLPMDAEPEPVSEIGVELDSDGCFSPGAADPSAISQAVEELSDETMLGVQYRAMRSARKDSLVTINGLFGMSGYRAWSLDSDHPMCVNCLYPFDVHSSYKDDYSDITRPGGINNVDNLPAANWLINKYPVNTTLSNDDNLCPVNVPGTPVVTWNIFQTAIWKLIDMGYHRIARCNGACQDAADALVTCALDQGNDYEPVCCQETLGLLLIWDHDVTGALSKKELMVEVPMSDIPGACPGGSRNRRFLEEDTSPVYSAALSATSTASAHFSNSVSSNGGTYYCQNNV